MEGPALGPDRALSLKGLPRFGLCEIVRGPEYEAYPLHHSVCAKDFM